MSKPALELFPIDNEMRFVRLLVPEPFSSHQEVKNESERARIILDSQKTSAGYQGAHGVGNHNLLILQVVKNTREDCHIDDTGLHRNISASPMK